MRRAVGLVGLGLLLLARGEPGTHPGHDALERCNARSNL